MIAQGRVENGVVVFADGIRFPEGQLVTVQTQNEQSMAGFSKGQAAIQQLIAVWKMDNPPSDEQVEKIVEEEVMRKYG